MITRTRAFARSAYASAVGLVFVAAVAAAQTREPKKPLPTTVGSRISDEAIRGDHEAFAALQDRIRLLNEGGVPVGSYHLAKAQAYLDLAFDEYHENDRSGVIEAAMTEAVAIVQALESKLQPPTATKPLRGEEQLRPDLWAQAEALKQHTGFACAGAAVAKLEVALLQAGHEATQGGWRRARPHIGMAEDVAAEAQRAAASCQAPRR